MSTYDKLTSALDILTEVLGEDAALLNDVSSLVEELAQKYDDMEGRRDSLLDERDDLNKTARDAGYRDATEALDVLATSREHNLRAILEDHHDSAGHRGPLRFCSDILCASVVAA